MSDQLTGLMGFVAAIALILFGVPVAVSMGLVGIVGFALLNGMDAMGFVIGSAIFDSVATYGLSVVPLFLVMGIFAARSGLSRDLFNAVDAFVGHFRGGLAIATIGACAGFGALCGSSLATTATMARVVLPEMRRAGYSDRLASGAIAAGGTLGILIPPSIIMLIYALLTEHSIGKLFAAALLPGILGTVLYALAVTVQTRIEPGLGPAGPRRRLRERLAALLGVWQVIPLFVVVMGGLYTSIFSPTEAAAVGAAGAFLLAWFRGGLTRPVLKGAVLEAMELTGMIFFVLIGAGLFNAFIETTQLPQMLIGVIETAGIGSLGTIVVIILFYLILGCLMDSMSMILLTVPVVFPVITALGFDPIWFGVIIVTVTEVGLITPPVGMNLFVLKGVARDLDMRDLMWGIVPFTVADAVRIVILVAVPGLSTWLPSLVR